MTGFPHLLEDSALATYWLPADPGASSSKAQDHFEELFTIRWFWTRLRRLRCILPRGGIDVANLPPLAAWKLAA